MALLNLRETRPSEAPGGETGTTEEVESVRELLESGEPPGLDRLRRFVVKPRPRLWKFGVGIWLWMVRIAQWFVRAVRWIGKQSVRLMRAARLAAFAGRRAQNFGARIGAVGRNWSSAEGRLGALGERLVRLGGWLIAGGAALAEVEAGVTELTKLAARFMAEASDFDNATPTPEPAAPAPTPRPPRRRGRRAAGSAPGPRQSPGPPSSPTREPDRSRPAARTPARAATAPAPPPGEPGPAPAPADPAPAAAARAPLPDDLPFYLRNQVEHLGRRARRETVEHLILELTEHRGWLEPGQLAAWFGMTAEYLTRRYLGPMTEAGALVRLYPDRPTHPDQAYRSARADDAPRR